MTTDPREEEVPPGNDLGDDERQQLLTAGHALAADGGSALFATVQTLLAARTRTIEQDRNKYLAAFSQQFEQREEYAIECRRLWPMEERFEIVEQQMTHLTTAILDVLPAECSVTRTAELRCTGFIGGTFENGATWTEDMCCLSCRLRALIPAPTVQATETDTNDASCRRCGVTVQAADGGVRCEPPYGNSHDFAATAPATDPKETP